MKPLTSGRSPLNALSRLVGALAALTALLLLAGPRLGLAQDTDDAAWARLAAPGTHALVRHAQAPGTGDPGDFRLGDCTTQRNLDEAGRDQARALGQRLRGRAIPVTMVLSSQWCRTQETARLMDVGPVEAEPALNSFFADRDAADAQTADVAARLKALPAGAKAVMVTHQVNITALTGIVPRSGEIVVVSVAPDGGIVVEGRIPPKG